MANERSGISIATSSMTLLATLILFFSFSTLSERNLLRTTLSPITLFGGNSIIALISRDHDDDDDDHVDVDEDKRTEPMLLGPSRCFFVNETTRRPLLSTSETLQVVSQYLDECYTAVHTTTNSTLSTPTPTKPTCEFTTIGQRLLKRATDRNQLLLTAQVGGMDGQSGDPMYKMFATQNRAIGLPNKTSSLRSWIPLVVEPVPVNFESLQQTYGDLQRDYGLECPLLSNWAISYDDDDDDEEDAENKGCTFCRYDTSETADDTCREAPDWVRYQLGTLDCDYSRTYFRDRFDKCIVQDPIKCGSLSSLVRQKLGLSTKRKGNPPVAMLQLDVEGYEAIILPRVLRGDGEDWKIMELPPVINYERKVAAYQDELRNTTNTQTIATLLKERGYILFGEYSADVLALRRVLQ